MAEQIKDLLIISHVQHYFWENQFWAFGPYVREIDIWADLFPSILIASPLKKAAPEGYCLPFAKKNISVTPVEMSQSTSNLTRILKTPILIFQLGKLIRKSSAIHVRLPGNIGAIGALICPLFSNKISAKYAGTWPDFKGEPISYRIQKSLLRSKWFNGPVTVYGDWSDFSSHVIPFFTSILDKEQIEKAKMISKSRHLHNPARLLFVGRLDKGKNASVLIDAVSILNRNGILFEVKIIGEGAEYQNIQMQIASNNLSEQVKIVGAIPFNEVLKYYDWGDILVLVSENAEGWPKVIAEAMAFGLVCFGSSRGLIPQMLQNGRGIIIDPPNSENLANKLSELLSFPSKYKEMSKKAAQWGQQASIETLRAAIATLLSEWWNIDLPYNGTDNNWHPSFD